MFGCVKDFQPVVDELVRQDQKEPYDWDAYAKVFFPKAEELTKEADTALKEGNKEKASELYLYVDAPIGRTAAYLRLDERQQSTASPAFPLLDLKTSFMPGKRARRSL